MCSTFLIFPTTVWFWCVVNTSCCCWVWLFFFFLNHPVPCCGSVFGLLLHSFLLRSPCHFWSFISFPPPTLQEQLHLFFYLFISLPLWSRASVRCRQVRVHAVLKNKQKYITNYSGVDCSLGSHLFQSWKRCCRAACPHMWGIPTLEGMQRSSQKTEEVWTLYYGFNLLKEWVFLSKPCAVWSSACAPWNHFSRLYHNTFLTWYWPRWGFEEEDDSLWSLLLPEE